MVSDPSKIFLDPGQAYTNVDRTLERVTAAPTGSVALADIFGDEVGAAAFLQNGFGPDLVSYLAEQSAKVTHRAYGSVLGSTQWEFLETFDPIAVFSLQGAGFHLGPVNVSRELMRDYFDPERAPKDNYGIAVLSPADQTGVLLTQLLIHLFINGHSKSRMESLTG